MEPPDYDGDMKDWPRIAKLQSDLLVQALVTRQTRVASYMLTKGQGLARFPWLGLTAARHHDYTHADGKAPGADGADGQRVLRDITRWHAEEFAYLLGKLKSTREGDGTVLDHTCLIYAHEHAEANPHKCSGLAMIVAGHAGRLKTGAHTRVMGTIGDFYLTVADEIMDAKAWAFPDRIQADHRNPGVTALLGNLAPRQRGVYPLERLRTQVAILHIENPELLESGERICYIFPEPLASLQI